MAKNTNSDQEMDGRVTAMVIDYLNTAARLNEARNRNKRLAEAMRRRVKRLEEERETQPA